MTDRSKSWHLRNWSLGDLRYELRYQQADGIHTWGHGQCGHAARGSGYCAMCLQREIDRRQALQGGGGGS